jgi:hypothetical protein
MCAINPKHKRKFIINVYTSHEMTQEEFSKLVYNKLLVTEISLNKDGRLRWHVEEFPNITYVDSEHQKAIKRLPKLKQ